MYVGFSHNTNPPISPEYIFMLFFFKWFYLCVTLEFEREDAYTYTYISYRIYTSFWLRTINNPFPTETMQIPMASGPSNPIVGRKIRHNFIQPVTIFMIIIVL